VKRFRVLNMADVSNCPEVTAPLEAVAEVVSLPADQEVLRRRIGEFDAYMASLAVRADAEVLARAKRLKVIMTSSTGLDHLDLEAAREYGITVLSLKNERAFLDQITATAELAWGLMLAAVRRIPWGFEAAKRGDWARDRFRGHQLSGKTFGILGYGRLGTMVADYAKAFRMRVIACDVRPFEAEGVEPVDFDALLREADVLSIHIHLTPENTGLIGREAFAKMKPGVVLVNTSRGAILDEAAFLEALESGRVGAAGVDVIAGEWRDDLAEHPLIAYARTHENLVITPHVGGVTYESQAMALAFAFRRLADFLQELDA